MALDAETCGRALAERDRGFDGLFYVGVPSTGVYCRPVCPDPKPRRGRVYFALRAGAEREGFRACLRCRPELAPGAGPSAAIPRLVAAAMACIEAGTLNDLSVDELARDLGVAGPDLRQEVFRAVGATPEELAESRRLALAKQLLQDTHLGLAEVAGASGFAGLRSLRAAFVRRFGQAPSSLRRKAEALGNDGAVLLRLDYRPPLAWGELLSFLGARATAGVEEVEGALYRRTVRLGRHVGFVEVRPDPERPSLKALVSPSLTGALLALSARLRALFDLDARPEEVARHLGRDPLLERAVARRPGLRVPGAFDGFDSAVRTVLGQQVTVRAATTVAGRLAEALGEPLATPWPALRRLSPTPEALSAARVGTLARLGMTGAKARTLRALAGSVAARELGLERHADPEIVERRLRSLPGIGPWTAEVVSMRALGEPDAFPASDLGVAKALGAASPAAAEERAERWRPWRSYAAMHLWASLAAGELL